MQDQSRDMSNATLAASAVEGEAAMYADCKTSLKATTPARAQLYAGILRKYPWPVYFEGLAQMMVYTVVAGWSWLHLYQGHSVVRALPLGWAYYCSWMIGHEAYHHTMAPSKMLNEFLGFFYMDVIMVSKKTWLVVHHEVHHRTPLRGDDRQQLFGSTVLEETFGIIYTVFGYWYMDFVTLVQEPKLRTVVAMAVRFFILLSMPVNALVCFLFSIAVQTNYNALLVHALPVVQAGCDGPEHQVNTAIDIFPDSKLAIFLMGGVNMHCVHHVFPSLPRAKHNWGHKKLELAFGSQYRCVKDWTTLAALWVVRMQRFENPVSMAELPEMAKGRYFMQFSLDLLSVATLVGIVLCCPSATIRGLVGV